VNNQQLIQKAGLPGEGRLSGVITIIQEDRFRLEDERGRGYLFTLSWRSGVASEDLFGWSGRKATVTVDYQGAPDIGAVATRVRAVR
jgi:hypothetical protein